MCKCGWIVGRYVAESSITASSKNYYATKSNIPLLFMRMLGHLVFILFCFKKKRNEKKKKKKKL